MAHTPGEWRLIPCDGNTYIVAPSDPRIIGDIATIHNMGADTDGNAALIKASPKLLAALERIVMHGERCNWFTRDDKAVVEEARTAIAEAKRTVSKEKAT